MEGGRQWRTAFTGRWVVGGRPVLVNRRVRRVPGSRCRMIMVGQCGKHKPPERICGIKTTSGCCKERRRLIESDAAAALEGVAK